jgi:hypothetical protein
MNRQYRLFRNLLIVAMALVFSVAANRPAGAQTASKPAAELASARGATVNGHSAIAGMTLFNNNHVTTGPQGSAVINAGKNGRLELGEQTDVTLQFSPETFGGELRSGRAVISVPAGVTVSVATARGTVITDGTRASLLTIEVDNKRTRILSQRGDARLVAGDNVERIQEGEEIAQTGRQDKWQHRRVTAAGAVIAATGQIVRPAATAAASSSVASITNLMAVGVSATAVMVAARDRSPDELFNVGTCRDTDSLSCQRRSGVTP